MQVGHHRLKTLAFFGKLLGDKGRREKCGWVGGAESVLESIRVKGWGGARGDWGRDGHTHTHKKKDHEVSREVKDGRPSETGILPFVLVHVTVLEFHRRQQLRSVPSLSQEARQTAGLRSLLLD